MILEANFDKYTNKLSATVPVKMYGKVKRVNGLLIESLGPPASIGDLCYIFDREKKSYVTAEVVGFEDNTFFIMPYRDMAGISPGCEILSLGKPLSIPVGDSLKGRILNGLGEPLDGKGPIQSSISYNIYRKPPEALDRLRIDKPFRVGVKAIDGCLPIGKGQRVGIFSGSGVGKSTLLGMMARGSESDINVIALIGERGREVKEFIDNVLGEKGLSKSVLVVVTSDQPALMRIKGAYVATTIAEYFRDQGKSVLFLMDSVTRFAMAQREVGLSLGEPPTTKGYTPSVFGMLPKLMERTGMGDHGSITAFYTVLVDADDFNEPISDACRSILDGHIMLSRRLASKNHYPSIDILDSVSRLSDEVSTPEQRQWMRRIKELIAVYEEARDLINIGAYVKGSNPKIDESISKIDNINSFLKQDFHELYSFDKVMEVMKKVV
ncbi:MAG: hypothetical protein ACD_79C00585G0004 [uncultured bacterium]|nr:MAG: hypothetical protein ACD_79C00585G0004 [uncultured bacterium]